MGRYLSRSWGVSRNLGNDGELIEDQEIRRLFRIRNTRDFNEYDETIHNGVHVWVGGNMARIASAATDPIFFMHHCFIDYLWWQWQNNNRRRASTFRYPRGNWASREGHQPDINVVNLNVRGYRGITNREVYGRYWAFNAGVTYQRRPRCSGRGNGTCTGPYLRCLGGRSRWEWDMDAWRWRRINVPRRCASVTNTQRTTRRTTATGRHKRSIYNEVTNWNNINAKLIQTPAARYIKPKKVYHESHEHLNHHLPYNVPSHFHPGSSKVIYGVSVQNDFKVNCQTDYDLWAFLPVKVVHLRPWGKMFDSHVVHNGKPDYRFDMYSEFMYKNSNPGVDPGHPNCYQDCDDDTSGFTKVILRSDGVDYDGVYREYVLLDNRQPIDGKVGYIGIRKPTCRKPTHVVLSVHDQCGRVCTPKCLVKGSYPPRYEPCSGAIKVDSEYPLSYGNTYSEAVSSYWNIYMGAVPMSCDHNIHVIFYCDYKTKWWPIPGCYKEPV